jgi:hypothetical protein
MTHSITSPSRWPAFFLIAVLFIAWLSGAAPTASADERAARQAVVTDSDGRAYSGLLTDLRAGQLTLKGTEQRRMALKSLVALRYPEKTSMVASADPLLLLAGGDVLVLSVEKMDAETLTARWARFPEWPAIKIPVETVRALLLNRPAGAVDSSRLFSQALDYREPHDSVLLLNGDVVTGEIAGLDEKQLQLESPQGKSAIGRPGIAAVLLNPALLNGETLKGEGALVSLIDGSRFRAHDLKLVGLERLTLRALFGAELSIPLSAVESLRFLGGAIVYLSDLTPVEYRFEPFLSLDWPLRADRNVTGGPLRLRGVEFPKGLGVHSRSTVTYRLDGKFRRFHAMIGIDDDTAGAGSATFEVLLDGKTVYRSGILTGTSPAADIERLDISGGRLMSLRVDYATQGDIQDHANWCEAVLIR